MEKVWDGGGSLGGLPQRNDESLPPKPLDIDPNEEAKLRWTKAAAAIYTRNADRVSARMAIHKGLWVARTFAPEAAVYFTHERSEERRVVNKCVSTCIPRCSP